VRPLPDYARLKISTDEFYRNHPAELLPALYAKYLADKEKSK
jgi:hypothetical protein